ncbi:MAG: hypothetical protein U1F44_03900 [Coriobacteriia bacterium]|nr:hypothetical protein [Coriobacteriia bacterium]
MTQVPQRFAATGADAAISITRAVTHHRIGLSLTFAGEQLDADRLARAARLSLDAEPVVGCAFRTDERRAYWERISNLDNATILVQEESADPEARMRSFQAIEITDEGPQAAVALIRASDVDYLGIKTSHVLADGQAAKQYAYLLADTYTRLGKDPSFIPEPNLRARPSGRDVWANLSPQQRREAKKAKSWTKATWPAPAAGNTGQDLTYRWATVPPERFVSLKSYGSERGCTVNDMMLTAVLRACISRLDPPAGTPLSLMYTADLRRYLPDAASLPISNLSISGSLDIERIDGESFDDTLGRVHGRMEQWAKMCHGAGPLASAERLAGLGYRTTERLLRMAFRAGGAPGKTYPWFTNIGVIDDTRLSFDGMTPDSGFVFGPASRGPSIVPVISTYRDALTVCMGFCESDYDAASVEGLLESIVGEIEDTCTPECA